MATVHQSQAQVGNLTVLSSITVTGNVSDQWRYVSTKKDHMKMMYTREKSEHEYNSQHFLRNPIFRQSHLYIYIYIFFLWKYSLKLSSQKLVLHTVGTPARAPWSSTGLYSYRKNPSVWTHTVWGKKMSLESRHHPWSLTPAPGRSDFPQREQETCHPQRWGTSSQVSIGKSKETMGKPWEDYGKTIGYCWLKMI